MQAGLEKITAGVNNLLLLAVIWREEAGGNGEGYCRKEIYIGLSSTLEININTKK